MKYLWPFALVGIALLWVTMCHDPQVRRTALQSQEDARNDSVARDNDHWKADFAAREVQRESVLAISARTIAELRARRTPLAEIPDSIPVLRRQIAVRDSITRADSIQKLVYVAMITDLQSLVGKLERESVAYRVSRDSWKRAAQPGIVTKLGRGVPYLLAGAVLWEAVR